MSPSEYDFRSVFLLHPSGVTAGCANMYQLESRQTPVARSWDRLGIPEFAETLKNGTEPRLAAAVSDTMTGTETTFFRDRQTFAELKTFVFPTLLRSRRPTERLTIWVPACSTGEDAYSIAMTIAEHFPALRTREVTIVASNSDATALARAESGVYSQFEVQRGLPILMLLRYFDQLPELRNWRIRPQLREKITWLRSNLIESLNQSGEPDLIWCGNRLTDIEPAGREEILLKMARRLRPDGFLIFGSSESPCRNGNAFQRVLDCRAAVYRPVTRDRVQRTA